MTEEEAKKLITELERKRGDDEPWCPTRAVFKPEGEGIFLQVWALFTQELFEELSLEKSIELLEELHKSEVSVFYERLREKLGVKNKNQKDSEASGCE